MWLRGGWMAVSGIGGGASAAVQAYYAYPARERGAAASGLTPCCGQPSCTCGKSSGQADKASAAGALKSEQQLSEEEQRQVQRLKTTDQKVRLHEQAHLAQAAGLSVGGASFQYVRGPDGRQYAVAGEVQIDVSPEATPEETIDKAQRIRAAALAPADPSPADRAVAAAAAQMEAQARAEIARESESGGEGQSPVEELLRAATRPEQADPARGRDLEAYRGQPSRAVSTFSLFA